MRVLFVMMRRKELMYRVCQITNVIIIPHFFILLFLLRYYAVCIDPKHPNCLRIIKVTNDGTTADISGTDGTPGCPPDGSGTKWNLQGTVEGNDILVDFTPKGGPPNLKGVFNKNRIEWPDGNAWTIKSTATAVNKIPTW